MWLPYFCVSSNLSCAEIVVHRDGPLWLGLRASGGLPGIFPPLVHNGDLLVDGGFLCNLPADIMSQQTGGGTTIAVDVSSKCDMQHEHAYVDAISGWKIIWNRLNPFAPKVTVLSIAAVLQRSSEIASVAMQRHSLSAGRGSLRAHAGATVRHAPVRSGARHHQDGLRDGPRRPGEVAGGPAGRARLRPDRRGIQSGVSARRDVGSRSDGAADRLLKSPIVTARRSDAASAVGSTAMALRGGEPAPAARCP